MRIHQWTLIFVPVLLLLGAPCYAVEPGQILINEIAWMGTTASAHDEWIELYNTTNQAIDLTGWRIQANDGSLDITLAGLIPAYAYYLLERTDDGTVPAIPADLLYSGALKNSGQQLSLNDNNGVRIDFVDGWQAGDRTARATMERSNTTGNQQWNTSTAAYNRGFGTPRARNSQTSAVVFQPVERLHQIANEQGAINVYFNKNALEAYACAGNAANNQVNLERRLMYRLNQATTTIDMATYEINLPNLINALIDKAANGVTVRVLADAKMPSDAEHIDRYNLMRLHLEQMARGRDRAVGTDDDIAIFADSIIFAVENESLRSTVGLPTPINDLPRKTVTVGTQQVAGHILALGEEKSADHYYSPNDQMHNKFVIIDGAWVWTGSWNFTVTGLYGSVENMNHGILNGNTQHAIEIHWPALAAAYTAEFNEMWGSVASAPDPLQANFHKRKSDNTPHEFIVGKIPVELYSSPGDDAIGHFTEYVHQQANHSAYFTIFAWSDQNLVDMLKVKWEGSADDKQGSLTGFDVRGVFDAGFWNQWWSASIDMTGRSSSTTSRNNPNTRWAHPAPVFPDREERKLHSKTMIIDACTTNSDPAVIVGSTNWSANGNSVNDENLLIIHDFRIANQFLQEFYARYEAAGGSLSDIAELRCEPD